MKKTYYSQKQKQMILRVRKTSVVLFFLIMAAGTIIGALLFLRPEKSDKEKRKLTSFPSFTISSFLDGSYLEDVALWYSDTFPGRDTLLTIDQTLKASYGIEPDVKMVGGNKKADQIPDSPQKKKTASSDAITEALAEDKTEASTEDETLSEELVNPPDSKKMEQEIQKQVQDNLYVKNGAAYSIYYFNQEGCEMYASMLNEAAKKLSGITNVYSVLVPDNSGVMLPEEELKKLGGSDQVQTIDYYYSLYDGVTGIDTIHTLREHQKEYLYYRTDHHWTSLAAYYVYENFCQEKGLTPNPLTAYEKKTYQPFLGTFYDTLHDSKMKENPDYVDAYLPMGTNKMKFRDAKGKNYDWYVVSDVSKSAENAKYWCFIGGDNPFSTIHNPNITDGSSCLVLKESYGNCFVPYLVDHYENVYVVDFRYADRNVLNYVKKNKVDDLIVINNISICSSPSVVKTIKSLLQ